MDLCNVVNENANTLSIPELIASLKSAFQNKYLSEVEAVLTSREEKLTREIETRIKEIDLLKEKHELLEVKCGNEISEKVRAERELEECKRVCFELKESNSRLTEERNEFNDRLTGIAHDKKIIIELKRKNCELECAKLRAEAEIEVYKKRFEELEIRVVRLQKDLMLLNGVEPLGSTSARLSRKVLRYKDSGESHKSCERDNNVKIEVDAKENVHLERDNSPILRGGGLGIAGEKEIIGSEEVESGPNVGKKNEMLVKKVHEIGSDVNVNLRKNAGPGRRPTENVDKLMGTTGSGRPLPEKVIIILDSDDDFAPRDVSSLREMATPVSNVHSRQAIIENGTEKMLSVDNVQPGKAVIENGIEKVLKRKRASFQGIPIKDEEDTSSSPDSEEELDFSSIMGMLQKRHVNRSHTKWESEVQMINEFCKNGELCMEAVCALYRQQKQSSARKSFSGSSTSQTISFNKLAEKRCITLAEFLIDGNPRGKLKKSKAELMAHDPKGLDDCLRIAMEHSRRLFEIYQKQEDPLFLN
ncbi:hypothetical protein JCGZ_20485 [Jatropha curcas]|uniref:Uncharacterized protein n=1 Tax=Jatropha curcas TaxID=180498 RepID=A0A067K0K5_JATCU|nr:girdin [Jatropha curcas]KDP25329.1 hypothetical protein JCGZ_20485 [Jatropha curcas]